MKFKKLSIRRIGLGIYFPEKWTTFLFKDGYSFVYSIDTTIVSKSILLLKNTKNPKGPKNNLNNNDEEAHSVTFEYQRVLEW